MGLGSSIAVYFVMWWIVLFVVLPWGVRTAHEAGVEQVEGQAESAPVVPHLRRKVIWTTVITAVLFAILWVNLHYGWIGLDTLPGPFKEYIPADR